MKRLVVFAVMAVFSAASPVLSAEIIDLGPVRTGFELEGDARSGETVHVSVSELRFDGVEIDGQLWPVPQVPTGSNLMDRGLPSLPYLSSEYLLERSGGIALVQQSRNVREIDLSDLGFAGIAPSKGHFDRSIDPDDVSWVFDDAVYGGDKIYPDGRAWVDQPFISGPLRGQAFRVPVAHWDPHTNILSIVEEAAFEVVYQEDAQNARTGRDRSMNALFAGRTNAVNADRFRDGEPIEAGRLLILAYDDFVDEVAPLAEWERLVGYPTDLVPLSAVPHSGSSPSAAEIKTYLQGLYDAPEGLDWIILVGDYQQIPNLNGVNEGASCDPCYTKLEGGDNRPDAAISRISAQNGDQVTVQVDKILHYEMNPDTGSAAEWYDRAFGVASNDTGGSPSYHDWERMNFLRDVLVDPAYTYTEFDELYINPSKADVTNSLEQGTSLGFYIGHGSDLSWVTSGYSVSDVHGLENGEMLPVIWDVACVNGAFHSNSECFAEAWLRQEGGGAVSFEAGTTNESWVPPCDAQRGFVDAIRLETDFVAGAQHLAGKNVCMDINGDGGSSEGNKFMEQSHLFGSVVLWPRTVAPSLIDEPEDFSVAGGFASLTVKAAGLPVAKEGGAIVNFYRVEGQTIVSLGSGLIDSAGLVRAAVTGDPTHCHIHGHNLVPQSFELAAQDDGRVNLDSAVYACAGTVGVRVADANVPGADPSIADTLSVQLDNGADSIDLVLTETDVDSGFFAGSAELGVDLVVNDGDALTVTYLDEDTGEGSGEKTAVAVVDCLPPAISSVSSSVEHDRATITFLTDEPGTTVLRWGLSEPPLNVIENDALTIQHMVTIDGLTSCEMVYFEVESTDGLGNGVVDDNGGDYFQFETLGWTVYFEETFDQDPAWAIENGSFSAADGWAYGQPTGAGQDSYGGPDPSSGHTGDNVYGVNLNGDAPAGAGHNELTLTTPSVDLSVATEVQLSFWKWLGVESDSYDNARVRISVDDGPWTDLWENDYDTIDESAWTNQVIDISDAAAGHANVRIQWTYGSSDGYWDFCGWNIDDVRIEGSSPCTESGRIFEGDFESGDCLGWTGVIGLAK